MYGLVNKGFEDMIRKGWGDERWAQILERANVGSSYFHGHESYPDSVTYDLVGAAAAVLDVPVATILERFGAHWILHTAKDGYGAIMDLCGNTLPEFLTNLQNLHTRVHMSFQHLRPPEFECRGTSETSAVLRYRSHRAGLDDFVVGLLKGLGERFSTPVRVTPGERVAPDTREFLVEWGHAAA